MEKPLTTDDLIEMEQLLLFWATKELWTIDEAACLTAGIDPDDVKIKDNPNLDIQLPEYIHSYQVKYFNNVLRQAILLGIETGSLKFYSLWVKDLNNPSKIIAVSSNKSVYADDIITAKTTLKIRPFLYWMRRKKIDSLRTILRNKEKLKRERERRQQKLSTRLYRLVQKLFNNFGRNELIQSAIQIEQQPYKPKHHNPALIVANYISATIWDKVESNQGKPNQQEIKDLIKNKFLEIEQVEPSENVINAIDMIM